MEYQFEDFTDDKASLGVFNGLANESTKQNILTSLNTVVKACGSLDGAKVKSVTCDETHVNVVLLNGQKKVFFI